jgi:hypothetical protein
MPKTFVLCIFIIYLYFASKKLLEVTSILRKTLEYLKEMMLPKINILLLIKLKVVV